MDMDQQPKAVDRKKRVQRLKKMIVLSIIIGIVVPWVVCAVLIAYVIGEKKELQDTNQRLDALMTALTDQGVQLMELRNEMGRRDLGEESDKEELLNRISTLEDALAQKELEGASAQPEVQEECAHKVYLTFDDGPSIYTNEILDILKKYNVKATFFVLGKESDEAKQAMQRIVQEGHTLGMHSYNHQYEQVYASREAFAEDFQKIRDYLFQVTGVESNVYRFPGGSSNTVTNVDIHVFTQYLKEQGVPYFDWNVSSGDAAKQSLSAETILANATRGIEKQSVSVILFHDAASRRTTVDALPMVIEKILAMEDTEILPITEDTELVQHVKVQE